MQKLKFDSNGLLTGVVQDGHSGEILMVAMMNAESIKLTMDTGMAHFWSRSRQTLWLKGETSGNIMDVTKVLVDCDGDALVLTVNPRGPACHTGERSCFYTELENDNAK